MSAQPSPSESSFRSALRQEIQRSDARLEVMSCLISIGLVMTCYVLFMLFLPNKSMQIERDVSWIVGIMVALFTALATVIRVVGYFERMKWISSFLGMTFVTAIIYVDINSYGIHALSSVPPYFYAFMISLTAYRMQPGLTLFATAVAVLEFGGLYIWRIMPLLPDPVPQAFAGLGPPVMVMKLFVLCGIGATCAATTGQMRRLIRSRVNEETRGSELERLFGRYVSPEVVREIVNGRALAPKITNAVIMFGDLRGFTAFSEGKDPVMVANILNEYFTIVCHVVEEEGGIVNKFLGDGFMAMFGVPVEQPDAIDRATRASQRLPSELESVLGKHGLQMGVAIHTGAVMAGEIGSQGRCEYTVIGETVNTASRIESLNRPLKTLRLVSSHVVNRLAGSYRLNSKGKQDIRGLSEPLEVFELLDQDSTN